MPGGASAGTLRVEVLLLAPALAVASCSIPAVAADAIEAVAQTVHRMSEFYRRCALHIDRLSVAFDASRGWLKRRGWSAASTTSHKPAAPDVRQRFNTEFRKPKFP